MDKEVIDSLIEKKPKLGAYREKLEGMQPGCYIVHKSWGLGKIESYDQALGKMIINFENDDEKQGHPMDPAFFVDKIDVIPENHVITRHRSDSTKIEQQLKEQPVEVIIQILEQKKDRQASVIDIEKTLVLLLGETRYKKWWNATKKLLVKEPRIGVPPKKTEPYVLRDVPITPEEEILEEFHRIKNPKSKILLAEKLRALSSDKKELEKDLPEIFDILTHSIQKSSTHLSQADRLHGVWVRNDLGRGLEEDVEELDPTSASIIQETASFVGLAAELPTAYCCRLLELLTRVFPDKWPTITLGIVREGSGKLLTDSINFRIEKEKLDLLEESFGRWVAEQGIKSPILLWIVKNRHSKKFGRIMAGLMTPPGVNMSLQSRSGT